MSDKSFLDILFGSDDTEEDNLDLYGLDEEEKELVKKGEYDPHNFEEEDLDEDDYYFEDDI